jgi:hypothetical protein
MEYGQRQASAVLRLTKERPHRPHNRQGVQQHKLCQTFPQTSPSPHISLQPDRNSRAPATLSSVDRRHSAVAQVAYILTACYMHK